MKFVNFYSGMAVIMISSIVTTISTATGELMPPLIVGALFLSTLVLGMAAGAAGAKAEIERLTRLEAGRQLQAECNARSRDRLEEVSESLRAELKDCKAAIEVFTEAQARSIVRITELASENAELRGGASAAMA